MGFVLSGLGLLLIIAASRNTQGDLFLLLRNDFTGAGSFWVWLAAIGLVGGIGYFPPLRPLSHVFLALIAIVWLLAENKAGRNVFEEFNKAISSVGSSAQG